MDNFFVIFFRDWIDGVWYFFYIILCILIMFAIFGIVGDRKRQAIAAQLKLKQADDIASGKVAERAARESKQILDVMEEDTNDLGQAKTESNSMMNQNLTLGSGMASDSSDLTKKEEVPSVLVIGADGTSNTLSGSSDENVNTSGPIVIESTPNESSQNQV